MGKRLARSFVAVSVLEPVLVPGQRKMGQCLKRSRPAIENGPNGVIPTSNRHPSLKPLEIFQLDGGFQSPPRTQGPQFFFFFFFHLGLG